LEFLNPRLCNDSALGAFPAAGSIGVPSGDSSGSPQTASRMEAFAANATQERFEALADKACRRGL